jgi:hypothetical protein
MTNKLLSAMIHDVYRWFIHIMYKFSAYLSSLLYETTWYSSRHDFYWKDANPSFFFFSWCADWGANIDVVGFCFLDLASNYEPPESLLKWLEAGQKPIYIGFGSLVSSFPLSFFDFLFGYLKEI